MCAFLKADHQVRIFSAAQKIGATSATAAIAVTLFHRFFAARSHDNSSFVVALAALTLACKINDQRRSLRRVIETMLIVWYPDTSFEEQQKKVLWDLVIGAETELLNVIGYQFEIPTLVYIIPRLMHAMPVLQCLKNDRAQKACVRVSNDIMKHSDLTMRYEVEKVALVVSGLVASYMGFTLPADWSSPYVEPDEYSMIRSSIQDMYLDIRRAYTPEEGEIV